TALPAPVERLGGRSGRPRLLVLGGSRGARRLNQLLPQVLARLPAAVRPEVWHQSGRAEEASTDAAYREHGVEARVMAFIDDIPAAYAWAELCVCRAGALTLAELCAAGLASVLVPFPHAVDDHQSRNAEALVAVGAALIRQQRELAAPALAA